MCNGLTAVVLPEGIEKVRNFTAQLEGAISLTAVAPSVFLGPALPRRTAAATQTSHNKVGSCGNRCHEIWSPSHKDLAGPERLSSGLNPRHDAFLMLEAFGTQEPASLGCVIRL